MDAFAFVLSQGLRDAERNAAMALVDAVARDRLVVAEHVARFNASRDAAEFQGMVAYAMRGM